MHADCVVDGRRDLCSAECGAVFEPFVSSLHSPSYAFVIVSQLEDIRNNSLPLTRAVTLRGCLKWDQCGEMLVRAGMGGMEEMGVFCEFLSQWR